MNSCAHVFVVSTQIFILKQIFHLKKEDFQCPTIWKKNGVGGPLRLPAGGIMKCIQR